MVDLRFQIIIIGLILAYLFILTYLVYKNKIRERDSFLWYLLLMTILFFSIFYNITDWVARFFHIVYPMSLVFLIALLGYQFSQNAVPLSSELTWTGYWFNGILSLSSSDTTSKLHPIENIKKLLRRWISWENYFN